MKNIGKTPPRQPLPGNSGQRPSGGWWWWLLIGFLLIQGLFYFNNQEVKTVSWTAFKNNMLANHDVARITVINREEAEVYLRREKLGQGPYADFDTADAGPHYQFTIGSIDHFEETLDAAQKDIPPDQRIEVTYLQRTNWWGNILSWVIPFAIIIAIWLFILGRLRRGSGMGGGPNIFDFGKSRAKLFEKDQSKITFEDVAGLDEVKVEVKEVVDFLKNPQQYTRLGAKIPKGVLLIGPPGTGKTLLAKAVAGEAGVPFYSISGSEFVEMFVGVGASRVRDLFKKAKETAPSIIFIDEIDAIGGSRGRAMQLQSNDERENTLNQMLTEMDGFGTNIGVIVMAATNRGEVLDKALLRPGRFDRQIFLELPTRQERRAIFEVHAKPLVMAGDVNLDQLAGQTPGFSGADIANICNEAALIAARRHRDAITMGDFMDAADRIIGGLEKKSKIISSREKRIIAYHEAGHATASWHLEHADNLLKVSIVPRGRSLGAAWYLPQENVIFTREQLTDRLCAVLGGRAAEEIVFNRISSGALDDLEKVTKQTYTMVAYYGLSDALRNISYYDSTGKYENALQKPYSEATAQLIDLEVQKIVDEAYQRTKLLLQDHRDELEELAHRLLEKEVVLQDELEEIFGPRRQGESIDSVDETDNVDSKVG